MAAATAVFNTFELLEHIVVQLPVADILTISRVCVSGRNVLEKSLPVRRILFDSELPGCDSVVNRVRVNARKCTPWIFRTGPLSRSYAVPGQFLVLSTLSTRFIIFRPRERNRDLVCHGIDLSVVPGELNRAQSRNFVVHWTTGEGKSLGFHALREEHFQRLSIFLEYVKTFYPRGDEEGRARISWNGFFVGPNRRNRTAIFASSVDGKIQVLGTSRIKQTIRKDGVN